MSSPNMNFKMSLVEFCILLSVILAANLVVLHVEARQQPAEMSKQAEGQNGSGAMKSGNDQNGGKMMMEQSRKAKMEFGEMKNLPPFPDIPGIPIPQMPMPFSPQIPGVPIPQLPFAPPFEIPKLIPPFPSIPNFPPLPPFNIPNIPFFSPPPA